jgi:DNA-nicking Smr family endonuclease
MTRRLHPEERSLWNRVIETVKPLHPVNPPRAKRGGAAGVAEPQRDHAKHGGGVSPNAAKTPPPLLRNGPPPQARLGEDNKSLDSHWERRFHKGAVIPDISIDLHGQGLASAHARLDRALDQAIHQKLRVILLVTGKARAHDRASGQGRGAIAAVVRDWLNASRHASHIAAVRQAHPRHGGDGALYIVLKK